MTLAKGTTPSRKQKQQHNHLCNHLLKIGKELGSLIEFLANGSFPYEVWTHAFTKHCTTYDIGKMINTFGKHSDHHNHNCKHYYCLV
jgi:hypothetical protein